MLESERLVRMWAAVRSSSPAHTTLSRSQALAGHRRGQFICLRPPSEGRRSLGFSEHRVEDVLSRTGKHSLFADCAQHSGSENRSRTYPYFALHGSRVVIGRGTGHP